MPEYSRILIVLIAGIGDMVLSSPALRAIRRGHPRAEIGVLTSTEAFPIAGKYPYVDRVWQFPIRQLRKSTLPLFEIAKILFLLRRKSFDRIINLYPRSSPWGARKMSALLFLIAKGRDNINGHNCKTRVVLEKHVAETMLELSSLSGGIPDNRGAEVFWDAACEKRWNTLLSERTGKIIGINPGGDRQNRRWRTDNYAALVKMISEKIDAKFLILGGPGEERLAQEIASQAPFKYIVNLSGKTSLDDLCYLTSKMDLLITNDSGPMHIGAAVSTPLVAIFGPEDPLLVGPYRHKHCRIIRKPVDCRPCDRSECESLICLDGIRPEEVLKSCIELLEQTNSSSHS